MLLQNETGCKMIKSMSNKICNYLIKLNIIKKEEITIYKYGCELFLNGCINLFFLVLVGAMFQIIPETIFFLVVFCNIRIYAGGYHATTHSRCIFCTIIGFILLMQIVPYLINAELLLFVLMIISFIVIWVLAPISDKNKPLKENEMNRYKKKTRFLLVNVIFMVFGLYIFCPQMWEYISFSVIAICVVAILVLAGYIKNTILKTA